MRTKRMHRSEAAHVHSRFWRTARYSWLSMQDGGQSPLRLDDRNDSVRQRMKQLPGNSQSTWLKSLTTTAAGLVAAILIIALLPIFALVAIIFLVATVPIIYSFNRQIQTGYIWQSQQRQAVDITPWHRRLLNTWLGTPSKRSSQRR